MKPKETKEVMKMKVSEVIEELSKYPSDLEVLTKKTDICGNVGLVFSVRQDSYGFFGRDLPCVLITDEIADEE